MRGETQGPLRGNGGGGGTPWRVSLSAVAAASMWFTFLLMIAGPPVELPAIPGAVRLYDLTAALTVGLGLFLASRGLLSVRGIQSPVFGLYTVYAASLLILPVLGLLFIPQAEPWMYLGDLRWLVLIVLAAIGSGLYVSRDRRELNAHIVRFWLSVVVVTWLVLLPQMYIQLTGGAVPWVVDMWYPEDRTSRTHGFHIYRFAGPFGNISGLATFGAISTIGGVLAVQASRFRMAVILSGVFFVLASGSRTALLICAVFLIGYVLRPRGALRMTPGSLTKTGVIVTGAIMAMWLAWTYNIGRIQSSGRLQSMLDWFSGETSLVEISGRGGARWFEPIAESQVWSPVGTLVNPAHALDLPAFDSYYVLMWAQARPIIIVCFLSLIIASLWFAWRNYSYHKAAANGLALAVFIVIPVYAATQNMMTGMLGRVLVTIGIIVVAVNSRRRIFRSPANLRPFGRIEESPGELQVR